MTWYLVALACVLFAWAFAEAFVWPVVPDVALAATILLVPDAAWLLVTATVAGSVAGGVTAMSAHRRGLRWRLPLVSDAMRSRVDQWLDLGPIGLVHQPLTAVPYKAFVVEGARRGFCSLPWAGWTAVFRGARMLVVAVVTVIGSHLVGWLFPEGAMQARLVVLTGGLVLFAIGWRMTWWMWATRQRDVPVSAGSDATRTMHP